MPMNQKDDANWDEDLRFKEQEDKFNKIKNSIRNSNSSFVVEDGKILDLNNLTEYSQS